MMKFDKWFFPDGESHLPDWMAKVNNRQDGRLTYQFGKYEMAMQHVKKRRVAVDVGGHVGLWAWFMARDFEDVASFEPCAAHRECWHANMTDRANAELFSEALGAAPGLAVIETRTPGSSGDTQIVPGQTGTIKVATLDSFCFSQVDFIKIDTEGYELGVLQGAEKTLLRCKPCVIVEQKGDMAKRYGHEKLGAVTYLQSLGAVLRGDMSGDYILSWD